MATKKTVLFHADQYKKLIHYTKEIRFENFISNNYLQCELMYEKNNLIEWQR